MKRLERAGLSHVPREVRLVANRALGRFARYHRPSDTRDVVSAFADLEVLEIGGPSAIFESRALLPVYDVIAARDAVNYASTTLWDSRPRAPAPRREWVAEATDLGCNDETYGGLLASHVIEHVANPLGALAEWRRVVVTGGPLLVVAPHPDFTFDHRRDPTSLEHLREDARARRAEDDMAHVPEVLERHDPRHDYFDGDAAAFARRCWDNVRHRALHHHVFTTRSLVACVCAVGLDVVAVLPRRPHHIVVMARRPPTPRSSAPLPEGLHRVLRRSPFPSDRMER